MSIVPLAEADLTARELRHLAAAWLSLANRDAATIDFDLFTILAGHPNSVNARKRFGEIKKRVREQVFGGGSLAGQPATPATPTPRKRKDGPQGAAAAPATPTKKGKGGGRRKTEPAVDGDNGGPVKVEGGGPVKVEDGGPFIKVEDGDVYDAEEQMLADDASTV